MHRLRRVEKTSWNASWALLRALPVGIAWIVAVALSLLHDEPGAYAAAPPPDAAARVTPAAPAGDCLSDPECVALLRSAKSLSRANQPHAALTAYQQAYERSHALWILINIGRMQQKLGWPADAVRTYRQYLQEADAAQEPQEQVMQVRGYAREAEQDLLRLKNPPPPREDKPLHKKWWFWTALAGTAVVAGAVTLGVVFATRQGATAPERMLSSNHLSF